WALLAYVAPPDSVAGDFSKEHNLAGWVDRHYLPGKIYKDYYEFGDNEGLLSTIPAIGTALLGVLTGEWLRSQRSKWLKLLGLILGGGVCLGLGYVWSSEVPVRFQFPIIKNIWTSSFVLWAGGWSLLLLALFYAIIDVFGWQAWAFFFVVIGVNAITIYVARQIINFEHIADFFLVGINKYASDSVKPILRAAGALAIEWLVLWYLYRNKTFLRV